MFQFFLLKRKGKKPPTKIFSSSFYDFIFPVVCLFFFPPTRCRQGLYSFGLWPTTAKSPDASSSSPRLRCTWCTVRGCYTRKATRSLSFSLFPILIYTQIYIYKYISRIYIYIYIRRRRREQKRAMEPSPWQSQRYRPLSISFSRYFFPPFSSFDFSFSYPHSCTPPHRARRKKPRHTHNNSLSEKPKASL